PSPTYSHSLHDALPISLQHKYPEAQWFLVQAKTIVDREGISEQLPEIMFHLAETKKYAGNPRVAIEEYKVASDLAKKDHRIGMRSEEHTSELQSRENLV